MVSSTVPVVHLSIGGTTTDYPDTGQVLNTNGVDAAGCPYAGTRNDESEPWQRLYPRPRAAAEAASTPSGGDDSGTTDASAPRRPLWLAAPYPNPANGELWIRFVIPASGPVRLGIYDLAGRLVRTSVDGDLEPGDYHGHVDLAGLAAGMYYCTLKAAQGTRRTAFVVMR